MKLNLDFASGKKTIVGVALFLVPLMAQALGYTIEPDSIVELVEQGFTIAGAVIALYGLLMKFVKFIKVSFKK